MGFGASLAFFAIGAILAFAVKWEVPGIDLRLIGWIFMGVGVIGGIITRMYTRTPEELRTRAPEETIEAVEPDVVSPRIRTTPHRDETRPMDHHPPPSHREGPR